MRNAFRTLFAGLFALSTVPALSAPPPSSRTPSEILWAQICRSAENQYGSEKTLRLTEQFLKKFPQDDKAVNARYMLAERQFVRKDYKGASVALEAFLRDNPKHPLSDSASFRLGESYYNLGVMNSALAAWKGLVERHKDSALIPDAIAWMAVVHIRRREWGQADERMKELLAQYPNHLTMPVHRANHGVILYHLGEYTEAAQLLQGLEGEKAVYYRGLSLFALKLYEDSVASLKNLEFSKKAVYLESAAFLKAEGFYQRRNYSVASAEFKTFNEKFPASPLVAHAHLRRAACALVTKNSGEALAEANKVLTARTVPVDVGAYASFVQGSALMEQKSWGPAARAFARVAPVSTLPELAAASMVRQAWCHRQLGESLAFDKVLEDAFKAYPSAKAIPLVYFLQGVRLFEKKDWESAGTLFEAGLIRHGYSVLSEAALGLMAVSFTNANRQDELVTSANSALRVLRGNYSTASAYWRAQSNYFIGKAYYDLKRFKEAIPYFDEVVTTFSKEPLAPASRLYLAWCLERTGNTAKALEWAGVVIDDKKADPSLVINASFLRGAAFFNSRKYDKAIGYLADFVKTYPKDPMAPEAQYLVGLSYHQKKVYGSAVEEWAKVIDDYPKDEFAKEAYLQIGDVYFKAGEFEKAASFFKQFHTRWPGDVKFGQMALWQEIQSYFNGKLDEVAITRYPEYMARYPQAENMEDAVKQLEMIYYRRGAHGDPKKLEEFLARYPTSPFAPSARYKLGEMAVEQEMWTLAAKHMERFVRDYPKDELVPEALLSAGAAYEKLEKPDNALDQYKVLMKDFASTPAAIDAAFRMGMIHFTAERYKEALDAFVYAQKKKLTTEGRANLLFNMALCRENLSLPVEAAATYGEFARISKDQERVREALLTAGYLLRKAEDYKGATGYLDRYLRDPGSPEGALQAVNLLAESWLGLKNEPKAMEVYERLVAMDPVDHDLRLTGLAQLAYLYEQKSEFKNAVRIYEKMAVSGGNAQWTAAAQERVNALTEALNQIP